VLVELLQQFLGDCPRYARELRAALQAGDANALERAAHSLKGAVMICGADGVAHLAAQLESIGREARLEEELETLCEHLSQQVNLDPE
jgi:HPt (histidine-containing phosphotransfer) domain-containing protein